MLRGASNFMPHTAMRACLCDLSEAGALMENLGAMKVILYKPAKGKETVVSERVFFDE